MNHKIFIIGLGKHGTAKIAASIENANTSLSRDTDYAPTYVTDQDTKPQYAKLGAQYTIESESWEDIQAEIESIYSDDDNGTVDLFKGTGYGNVWPVLDELKATYPTADIYLLFNANQVDDKLASTDPSYKDYFPNLQYSRDTMMSYIMANNPILVERTTDIPAHFKIQ